MQELPLYQVLDYSDVFRDTIFKRQFDLEKTTSIKPLSYFNTLPSGDIISDADCDTFLCDQMFQEEFDFTVADDMSVSRATTLMNTIGKSGNLNIKFLNMNKVPAQVTPKLKKLNTFHMGDKESIPCSTGDHYSNDGMCRNSGKSSRASLWNDESQYHHSMRNIENNLPSPPQELAVPQDKIWSTKTLEVKLPSDTPNFGLFAKKLPSINIMKTHRHNSSIIEELVEEDIPNWSKNSRSGHSSRKSKKTSPTDKPKLEDLLTTPGKQATQDIKKRLLGLAYYIKSDNHIKKSVSSLTSDISQTSNERIQHKTDEQATIRVPITSASYVRDSHSERASDTANVEPATSDYVKKTSIQILASKEFLDCMGNDNAVELFKSSQLDGHDMVDSQSAKNIHIIEVKKIETVNIGGLNSFLIADRSVVAACNSSAQFNSDITLEKKLSDIEQKIIATRVKNQLLDIVLSKSQLNLDLNQKIEIKTNSISNIDCTQEYKPLDCKPSSLTKMPKSNKLTSLDINPFFLGISKLAANKKKPSTPADKTPTFQFTSGASMNASDTNKDFTSMTLQYDNSASASSAAGVTNAQNADSNTLNESVHLKDLKTGQAESESPFASNVKKMERKNKVYQYLNRSLLQSSKNQSDILFSPEVSKQSERCDPLDYVSSYWKEKTEFFTSRDVQSPALASVCQVRFSANSKDAEKEKINSSSSRNPILTLSSLKSKFGSIIDTPYKRSTTNLVDQSINKKSIKDIKSSTLLQNAKLEVRQKLVGKTAIDSLNYRHAKSIKDYGSTSRKNLTHIKLPPRKSDCKNLNTSSNEKENTTHKELTIKLSRFLSGLSNPKK